MTGSAAEGTWFDRTREYNARLRGKELEKGEAASTEVVRLSPLPCYGLFVAAAEKLRGGDRGVEFPPGSFPPGLPFVAG
jgi:hypothetical protein